MPYGVDKKLGGDNKKNDAWMERCVTSVMGTGKEKSNAIAICKAQMKKMHEKKESNPDMMKSSLEEIVIDYDIITRAETLRNRIIRRLMEKGNTFEDSRALYSGLLARSDYDFDSLSTIIMTML